MASSEAPCLEAASGGRTQATCCSGDVVMALPEYNLRRAYTAQDPFALIEGYRLRFIYGWLRCSVCECVLGAFSVGLKVLVAARFSAAVCVVVVFSELVFLWEVARNIKAMGLHICMLKYILHVLINMVLYKRHAEI